MTDILRALSTVPIPLILLLAVGVLFYRRRFFGRGLVTAATVALLAMCLPVIGRLLEAPLIAAASVYDASQNAQDANATAIVVPTAGIFADPAGFWWPASESVARAVAGRKLHAATGLPMLLIGGSPRGEAESEAMVVARATGLVDTDGTLLPDVYLETAAQNSTETAAAAQPILDRLGAEHVVLVTSPTHTARMSASLRHLGYEVSIHIDEDTPMLVEPLGVLEPYIPSADGLSRSKGAIHEYLGILWYLLNGYLTVADLRFNGPASKIQEAE